jgi:hypothetical protein
VLTTAASQHLLLLLLPCRSSPRIFNLVLLVMGYGTAHKLFGFVWKGQMKVSMQPLLQRNVHNHTVTLSRQVVQSHGLCLLWCAVASPVCSLAYLTSTVQCACAAVQLSRLLHVQCRHMQSPSDISGCIMHCSLGHSHSCWCQLSGVLDHMFHSPARLACSRLLGAVPLNGRVCNGAQLVCSLSVQQVHVQHCRKPCISSLQALHMYIAATYQLLVWRCCTGDSSVHLPGAKLNVCSPNP